MKCYSVTKAYSVYSMGVWSWSIPGEVAWPWGQGSLRPVMIPREIKLRALSDNHHTACGAMRAQAWNKSRNVYLIHLLQKYILGKSLPGFSWSLFLGKWTEGMLVGKFAVMWSPILRHYSWTQRWGSVSQVVSNSPLRTARARWVHCESTLCRGYTVVLLLGFPYMLS